MILGSLAGIVWMQGPGLNKSACVIHDRCLCPDSVAAVLESATGSSIKHNIKHSMITNCSSDTYFCFFITN